MSALNTKTAADWRPDVRELIHELTHCAWRSGANEVERVIALAMATQFAEVFAKKDGGLGNAEICLAMERLGKAGFEFIKTAQLAGIGLAPHTNTIHNTSEV